MPPLAVGIPVITRSDPVGDEAIKKSKAPRRLAQKPRIYKDGPLPAQPTDNAPKNARIIHRNLQDDPPTYQLKIGEVEISHVGVEEILDYVSPLQLEVFENDLFREETEALNLLEAEKENRRREKLERQKERAKRKGVVVFEDVDSTEDVTEGGEVEVGKHGRARPTYTHLFKKVKERKRRKRDSDTSDLRSLSDDENEGISAENEPAPQTEVIQTSGSLVELPKRRRRRRDKVTEELLPLSPIAQQPTGSALKSNVKLKNIKQRRKRHPLTGELMPIGWNYDPDEEKYAYEMRRQDLGSQSFKNLSISQEPSSKRQRIDTATNMSRSPSPFPTKAHLAAQHSPLKSAVGPSPKAPQQRTTVLELLSSGDESGNVVPFIQVSKLKSTPKAATPTSRRSKKGVVEAIQDSSTPESSPQPEQRTSISSPSTDKIRSTHRAKAPRTSILNPSVTRASSTDPPVHLSDSGEDSAEDLDEDEWFIEAILEHQQSDPRTHPPNFGKEPLMLYLVKWEGFEEPTWEPIESFGDRNIVLEYRRRVGLDLESGGHEEPKATVVTASTDPRVNPARTKSTTGKDSDTDEEEDSKLEDEEFEVEDIVAHHLSDPRTHPAALGRTPVVLYKVKWKGYEKETWEPASSFEDKSILQQYHERISRNTTDRDNETMPT